MIQAFCWSSRLEADQTVGWDKGVLFVYRIVIGGRLTSYKVN